MGCGDQTVNPDHDTCGCRRWLIPRLRIRYGSFESADKLPVKVHIGRREGPMQWSAELRMPGQTPNHSLASGARSVAVPRQFARDGKTFSRRDMRERFPDLKIVSVERCRRYPICLTGCILASEVGAEFERRRPTYSLGRFCLPLLRAPELHRYRASGRCGKTSCSRRNYRIRPASIPTAIAIWSMLWRNQSWGVDRRSVQDFSGNAAKCTTSISARPRTKGAAYRRRNPIIHTGPAARRETCGTRKHRLNGVPRALPLADQPSVYRRDLHVYSIGTFMSPLQAASAGAQTGGGLSSGIFIRGLAGPYCTFW